MISKKTSDALSRSDTVLIAALALILATASAAIGSALTYNPSTDKVRAAVVAAPAPVRVISAAGGPDAVSTELLAEHRCLSEALYYEARGEGAQGQKAVAEVVFHRMNNGNYGHSICAVVYEGASHPGCQFTFTCDGELTKPKEEEAWRDSERLAAQILTGEVTLRNTTGGATNYHAVSVAPGWADSMSETAQIGKHVFYREQLNHSDS
jgi:spore germination cell wall hydrolase CwlJ-like protein